MSPKPPPAESSEAARSSASVPKESEPSGTGVASAAVPGAAHETNSLWVDNLPAHVGEDDFMAAFAPHEALDCVVKRAGSRSNAFVFFRFVAESRAALEALLGSKVKCAFIQIEFAQPRRHTGSATTGWSSVASQVAGGSGAQGPQERGRQGPLYGGRACRELMEKENLDTGEWPSRKQWQLVPRRRRRLLRGG